jgi:SAM-dependent methyltransferase
MVTVPSEFLSGEKLYGDDFDGPQLTEWYRDEAEGYADLGAGERDKYEYLYHALNVFHGFDWLPAGRFENALGVGSAYGDEFVPILHRIDEITLLDPSDSFQTESLNGVPLRRMRPVTSGTLQFPSHSFDLVLCLSALHHIANVSHVVGEIARVMKPGAFALLREPVFSMGDWSQPRRGLTKRERGIPLKVFRRAFLAAGLRVVRESPCCVGALARLWPRFLPHGFNDPRYVQADALVGRLLSFNYHYHRTTALKKLAPSVYYFIVVKE